MRARRTKKASNPAVAEPRRDAGTTFIEILVAIVLLGLASVGVLTAIGATVRSTSVHDRVATAQAQLADAGDVLSDAIFYETFPQGDRHYKSCATPTDYDDSLDPVTGDWTTQASSWPSVSVIAVDFWNGTGWISTSDASCVGGELQRITLRSTIDDYSRDLVVVKRQATVADSGGSFWNDDMFTPTPNCAFSGGCP